jgi:tryptophan-rich hypothetical protein
MAGTMPRVQRRFLLHSRWTALVRVDGSDGERHFEVIDVPRGDVVTLRAVLTQRDYPITVASLDDPLAWALGWQQLPSEPHPG